MGLISLILEVFKKPSMWEMLFELMLLIVPLWVAVFVGVILGWAWRPNWAIFGSVTHKQSSSSSSSPTIDSNSYNSSFTLKSLVPSCLLSWNVCNRSLEDEQGSISKSYNSSLSMHGRNGPSSVNEADLRHLYQLVETQDGGPSWIHMMDRSTSTMTYQAWRRDPPTGPPRYRSRTVFEDATPDMVRDFFWDDEFRSEWDDMLIHHAVLEESKNNGTMIVQWVRKFSIFCSDREYVIDRRIWESGGSYYCVTKGVPFTSHPRRDRPRHVDLYYSSWCIRPAESQKREGQLTACEVILFHHEDMGIPWELAKLRIRQGMWNAVKKIDPGLRLYQEMRSSGAPLSHSALMAHTYTRVSADYLKALEGMEAASGDLPTEIHDTDAKSLGKSGVTIPRAVIIGGAVALACTIDRGLLTKAVIFGVARRFARVWHKT